MTEATARTATEEIHRDEDRAVNFQPRRGAGVNPREKPSPVVAALSSFVMFALGAIIPLLPYLLGSESLWVGLSCSAVGLLVAGAVAARFTKARCGSVRDGSWRSGPSHRGDLCGRESCRSTALRRPGNTLTR